MLIKITEEQPWTFACHCCCSPARLTISENCSLKRMRKFSAHVSNFSYFMWFFTATPMEGSASAEVTEVELFLLWRRASYVSESRNRELEEETFVVTLKVICYHRSCAINFFWEIFFGKKVEKFSFLLREVVRDVVNVIVSEKLFQAKLRKKKILLELFYFRFTISKNKGIFWLKIHGNLEYKIFNENIFCFNSSFAYACQTFRTDGISNFSSKVSTIIELLN